MGNKYAERIARSSKDIDEYLSSIRCNKNSLFLHPTTPYQLLKLMNRLPNKRSSGHDGINNIILKEIGEYICTPLTYLLNESMTTGVFPDAMKIAEVVPLHKGKARYEVENYRPISLLLTISKLLEKLMYSRVYDFLISSNQLYESQYGFRKNHACKHAVGEFISDVVKNIQLGKITAGIFLDLSKAFDTLEHSVIYKKLERYGIRGTALDWFKNYLSDRKLRTKCRTASSSTEARSKLFNVTVGTPQGSCLGPLIFLIFCNDLRLHLTHLQCIQFADDTTLFTSHKSKCYLEYCVTMDLERLHDWFKANKLTLNLNKSVMLVFGGNSQTYLNELRIGGCEITIEKATKFLGVWIDLELNWNEHISRLILKLKNRLGLLKRSKNFLNPHCMKVLYYAQIHSNLSYCLSMWGNMIKKTQLEKISKIQDQCVATIDKSLSVKDTYKKYKLLKFEDMITHETNKLWHKHHLSLLPAPLMRNMQTDFTGQDLSKSHGYNTRNKAYLNLPRANNGSYRKSFLSRGLKTYSELPLEIRSANNIATFSSSSKLHLLERTISSY